MPRNELPPTEPKLTELEKLEIKRHIINYANKNGMRYRDYGGYVLLEIPVYSTERIVKGEFDAALHAAVDKKDGPAGSSRQHKKRS